MGDRSENAAPSPATRTMDDVPDDLLEQIFLRTSSSLHLVRAACTCKRWRSIVASGGFLRRFRSLHPHPIVAGHYLVDEHRHESRPPGCNPVFTLSPSADTVGMRPEHFSLDFFPGCDDGRPWDLADSRDGILLFTNCADDFLTNVFSLVVCEPMTRRCCREVIHFPDFLMNWDCFGAFLLDGEAAEDTGGRISVSNFRIIVTVYDEGAAWTSVFSSADYEWRTAGQGPYAVSRRGKFSLAGNTEDSIYWTTRDFRGSEILALDKRTHKFSASSFPEQLPYWPAEPKLRVVHCDDDGKVRIALLDVVLEQLRVYIKAKGRANWALEKRIPLRQPIYELRDVDDQRHYSSVPLPRNILSAVEGSVVLGMREGVGTFSVNITTMEFKRVYDGIKYPAYTHHLPWPPTIRACLPCVNQ